MYSAPFEYHRAGSVDEALALLDCYGDEAKLVAGGHSLIPLMKLRFAQPGHLIDIRRIPELAGTRQDGDQIVIGALTTYRQLQASELLRRHCPLVVETASRVGDPQVRSLGTIGGSLAHADPASDMPAAVLALGATLAARGAGGERQIAADDFFLGLFSSALAPDEILTEVRIPAQPPHTGGAYEKYSHPASGYALCGAAALVALDGQGRVERARVALTGIGSKATRASGVEEALQGQEPTADAIAAAASHAAEGIELRADEPGSEGYNAQIAQVYTRRALMRAVERAQAS